MRAVPENGLEGVHTRRHTVTVLELQTVIRGGSYSYFFRRPAVYGPGPSDTYNHTPGPRIPLRRHPRVRLRAFGPGPNGLAYPSW